MRTVFVTICLLILAACPAGAQFYETVHRPSRPGWQQLATPHFNIIFQKGEDSTAVKAARILEARYEAIQGLVGGKLKNMPVVLNGYNDRSNGYVTPFPFRLEVEIPPIKGKGLNPATGGWLENVMPHELVHALHMSVNPPYGFTWLLHPFFPDMGRAVHLMSPPGLLEGIAVYHESGAGGGRGNYPYFTNRFNANFGSDRPWGMGEMHYPATVSRPFNRHYLGGHEFSDWLLKSYGREVVGDNLDLLARWPFFGYGYALRRTTGKWPSRLYAEFEEEKLREEERRIRAIRAAGQPKADTLDTFEGPDLKRPLWLSDGEIVFYGSFYNRRPGFWKYNLASGEQTLILETQIVEDFWYDLSPDKTTLLYSRYRPHPYHHNTWVMDAYEYDINGSEPRRLSDNARVYAPVYAGDAIWALQTDHEAARWVRMDGADTIDTVLTDRSGHLIEVRPHPRNNEVAVVANRNGVQALWLTEAESAERSLQARPTVHLPGASVFDASWSPDGRKLLFTADYGRVMNLYELDVEEQRLVRITNSLYNAMEGSYSPDGSALAYVSQVGDYRKLVIIDRSDAVDEVIADSVWNKRVATIPEDHERIEYRSDPAGDWQAGDYRPGLKWLRPRGIVPVYEEASFQRGPRFGAVLLSGDVLRRNSYQAGISTSNRRLWYNASYRHSGFFPGFRLNAFNLPTMASGILLEERGLGGEIPITITTESNTRFSGFSVSPGLRLTELRRISTAGSAVSDWTRATTGSLNIAYNHRIQQNIRDIQPNTGAVLYAFNEIRWYSAAPAVRAMRAGISFFTSPLRRLNQSLRLDANILIQDQPGIRTAGFAPEGFSDNVLAGMMNAYSLNTRYTIPIWNPGRAGLLFPVQVDRFYGVIFSSTVGSLTENSLDQLYHRSRSVYGLGLRMGLGLFNARFDIGFAIGYEPARNAINPFAGAF
ncbi:MAG: hypothetical protein WD266_10550 [Balneolales bacterium]